MDNSAKLLEHVKQSSDTPRSPDREVTVEETIPPPNIPLDNKRESVDPQLARLKEKKKKARTRLPQEWVGDDERVDNVFSMLRTVTSTKTAVREQPKSVFGDMLKEM